MPRPRSKPQCVDQCATDVAAHIYYTIWGNNLPIASSSSSSSSSSGGSGSSSSGMLSSDPFDALFLGLSEEMRLEKYYFKEENNMISIEAEHFAAQRYGNDNYRGKRWWMVNTEDSQASDREVFTEACEMARQEFMDVEANKSMLNIIGGGHTNLSVGWNGGKGSGEYNGKKLNANQVFETFKCDPDPSHVTGTSGNQYLELLPDMLYSNFDSIPHALSHWKNGGNAPKAFFRVNATGGSYRATIRMLRAHPTKGENVNCADTDSGDMFVGVSDTLKYNVGGLKRTGPNPPKNQTCNSGPEDGKWVWKSPGNFNLKSGENFFVISGREDGFEVDKIVLTKGNGNCGSCNGTGPDESPTM